MDEIAQEIAKLQNERKDIIETANLRAAWYEGRIFQLQQILANGIPLHPTPDGSGGDSRELQQPLPGD